MAFDLRSIQKGGTKRAPIMVIYSAPGMGKTTFAACAPSPIFIRTEDGLGALEVDTFPEATSYQDVQDQLAALYEENPYQTVVIDSLSQLEPLILDRVARDHGKNSHEDLGFGKSYVYALDYWRDIMAACKGLADQGKTIVLIAHAEVVTFQSPETDPYDRYQPRLHKRAFAYVCEQADIVGFAGYPVHVRKSTDDKGKGRGVATGERQLTLVEKPSMVAKNRYGIEGSVPLIWDEFAKHLPGASAPGSTNASKGE